jgi:hypothetical protein
MMVRGVNVNPLHSGTASSYFTTVVQFLLTAVSDQPTENVLTARPI